MATQTGLSLTGALVIATANQTRMASSVLHLFKKSMDFNPSSTTTKAEFQAVECDYDGYAPLTITAFGAPILMQLGYGIIAPSQTFRWAIDTDAVGNSVGGWWLETAGGVVMDYGTYDPGLPMTGPGMAVVVTPIEYTPAGPQF